MKPEPLIWREADGGHVFVRTCSRGELRGEITPHHGGWKGQLSILPDWKGGLAFRSSELTATDPEELKRILEDLQAPVFSWLSDAPHNPE